MTEEKTFVERRKGPDFVVKAVWWITGISWALIIVSLLITMEAQPRSETFIDRLYKVSLRHYWDENLLQYTFYILLINLAACVIGLVFNALRHKRKTDRISKSIIAIGVLSLLGIIRYLTM